MSLIKFLSATARQRFSSYRIGSSDMSVMVYVRHFSSTFQGRLAILICVSFLNRTNYVYYMINSNAGLKGGYLRVIDHFRCLP